MIWFLYTICGVPWTIYALSRQVRIYGFSWHVAVSALINWAFWPLAPIWAAIRKL